MVKNLQYVAGKLQVSNNTAIHVDNQTDYLPVSEMSIEPNQVMESVKIMSGRFSQEKLVKGSFNCTVKGKVPFTSAGTAIEPPAGIILECSCFSKSIVPAGAGFKYIYERSMDSKSMSVLDIERSTATSGSTMSKVKAAYNVMYNSIKIPLDSCKIPVMEFAGIGCCGGVNEIGGVIPFKSEEVFVAPEGDSGLTYTVNNVENTILSTGWEFVKASIEFTNKLQQIPTMVGDGFKNAEVTDQDDKFTASILANIGDIDGLEVVQSGESGGFTVTYGSVTGLRVEIQCDVCQLSSAKDSFTGDLVSSDLAGNFLAPVKITFNSDLV